MTNREVLIHDLQHHQPGEPSEIVDYIECPYWRDEDCRNSETGFPFNSAPYNENCAHCKAEWLEKEWDE